MREVPNPIVKEGRDEMKTRRHNVFSMLFAKMILSKMESGEKMFRGSNIGYYNPIFIPRHGKFKGYMRERRRSTFNKNK